MLADNHNPKKRYNISLIIMIFCICSFTIAQYIPIYFTDNGIRTLYHFIIYILLIGSASRTMFKRIYKSEKENISTARFYSIMIGAFCFIFFGLWTIGLFFSVWTEASTYFVRKDNSQIKIIKRYINEGAFGGGTEESDYETVLHRPITPYFKMETSVDTLFIDRQKWERPFEKIDFSVDH